MGTFVVGYPNRHFKVEKMIPSWVAIFQNEVYLTFQTFAAYSKLSHFLKQKIKLWNMEAELNLCMTNLFLTLFNFCDKF